MIEYKPVTWDSIKELLRAYPDGLTNREISIQLDARQDHVTNLTTIMLAAGEIKRRLVKEKPHHRNYTRLFHL